MPIHARISTSLFTSERARAAFVDGWTDAGGYLGDTCTDCPWCAPWTWAGSIKVEWRPDQLAPAGYDAEQVAAYQAGAGYWRVVGPEVRELLDAERAAAAALEA